MRSDSDQTSNGVSSDFDNRDCIIGDPKQHCASFHKCSIVSCSSQKIHFSSSVNDKFHLTFPSVPLNLFPSYDSGTRSDQWQRPVQAQRDDLYHGILLTNSSKDKKVDKSINTNIEELIRISTDIDATNPNLIHFQQVLNSWVCDEYLLDDTIICGDASVLYDLFVGNGSLMKGDDETNPINASNQDPILPHYDIGTINEKLRAKLYKIASIRNQMNESISAGTVNGTLILLRGRCNFVAGLLIVHQHANSIEAECRAIRPHLHMITALFSIVANVEEQKRLAEQSQVFLVMAQSVFSSIR